MLLDIVRFIAFLLVFAGYVWIGMRLFNLRQRLSVGPKQYRLFLLAAAEAALVWAFVVAVLLVLASYWTPGLLVTAIVFAWTSVGLAWTLQSLSGGPPEKSSALTAAFGTSAVLRVGIVVLQMMAALAFVVW